MASSKLSSVPNLIRLSSRRGPNELDGVGISDNDDDDRCLAWCESDLEVGCDCLRFFSALPSVSLCDDCRVDVAPDLLSAAVNVSGAA
jgi:hypothetical protein